MKVKLEVYSHLCALSIFEINEVDADTEDFGVQYDTEPENAEPYGCGNMRFMRTDLNISAFEKYNITEKQYNKICDLLEEKLSFGCCGWCS